MAFSVYLSVLQIVRYEHPMVDLSPVMLDSALNG